MNPDKKPDLYSNILKVVMVLITCSVFYSLGFVVGRDGWPLDMEANRAQPKNVNFSLLWEAWNKVEKNYVGKPNEQKMIDGAISGMMQSLNDPYTIYMPAETSSQFRDDISGHFEGVGIQMEMKDGKLTVVAPLEESPAQKAGIKAQDVIIKVDGKSTEKMSVEDAVNIIRGKAGTLVTLTVAREGSSSPLDFKVKRETIFVKSVKWEIKNGNIGYIKVNQFGEDTFNLFAQAVDEMVKKKPKGVIIDMRGNPGGLLNTAIDMASLVMEPGVVVKVKDRKGRIEVDKTTYKPRLSSPKMVVLVDRGSASASEIFAGAIQDSNRGKIIGEKTFGKGSVQDLTQLADGSSIKITIAKWLTPKGRQIDGKGIEPDIKISNTDGENIDAQLNRAIEEINK